MNTLTKLTWVELKLFAREPTTMVFTFAFPFLTLFVMGGVFGNTPDEDGEVFRGVGPLNYYIPAYIGLVVSSIGLISLPVHLAAYRERGVLKRLRASSVSTWNVFGSQVLVSIGIAALSSILLIIAAALAYDVQFPGWSVWKVAVAFLLGTLSFASIGVLLGAVLPTARSAQGAGLLLFFAMMMLAGAGPPREVMTDAMRVMGDVLPLTYVVEMLQDPWLGFAWNPAPVGVVAGIMVVAAAVSIRVFRWE